MKPARPALPVSPTKTPTGVGGLDEMTGGGFPRGRTTLVVGGPGSGKTVLSLQFLAHGAVTCAEPGIFVAFEETSKRIVANASSFGWQLAALIKSKKLFFLDAQPKPDMVQSGEFDLCGMLAVLEAQIDALKGKRIVFDALDVILALLPDPAMKRREIYRLHDWLLARELTGVITSKAKGDEFSTIGAQPFDFMQFMVDCAVILNHQVVLGVSQRNLRVLKYRGSGFDENESAFLIASRGLEVAVARGSGRVPVTFSTKRVSSGVERLDTMLGGGYYRGSSVLITGFSGTAKTTLSGAFTEAACLRGERTLFISFDSDPKEVVRNLSSVNIRLDPHVKSGVLKIVSARTITGSAETYLLRIKTLADEHGARCVVIDPVSTWYKSGSDLTVQSIADRLIDWARVEGITMVCTSLLDEMSGHVESNASLQISALADTWIHLSYLMQAGERNRGLSIVKSRGAAHSNQLRELILSDNGVTLTDIYTAGGEVLMGTLRWEKEHAEEMLLETAEIAARLKRVNLDVEEAELEARMKALQVELVAKQVEKELLTFTTLGRKGELSRGVTRIGELRGADVVTPRRK